ncbi:MAG: DUF3795 domain-containing protein [Patescibacteria group bacterium]
MADNSKIGVCGLICSKCPLFVAAECSGCKPNEVCPLPNCSKKKGVELCFKCKEFPCNLSYKKGPIVKELLDYFKEKKKES